MVPKTTRSYGILPLPLDRRLLSLFSPQGQPRLAPRPHHRIGAVPLPGELGPDYRAPSQRQGRSLPSGVPSCVDRLVRDPHNPLYPKLGICQVKSAFPAGLSHLASPGCLHWLSSRSEHPELVKGRSRRLLRWAQDASTRYPDPNAFALAFPILTGLLPSRHGDGVKRLPVLSTATGKQSPIR
jgi:hypothetical protein